MNFKWVTLKENVQHAIYTGLQKQYPVKQIFNDRSFWEFPSIAEVQCITKTYHISDVYHGLQSYAKLGSGRFWTCPIGFLNWTVLDCPKLSKTVQNCLKPKFGIQ